MIRSTGRVAALRVAKTTVEARDVLKRPDIVRLTEEYLVIKRAAEEDAVDAVVRLGRILAEGRPAVKHRWLEWLVELETGHTTADQYIAIARFSDRFPTEFAALRVLGTSKLHRIVRLRPAGVRYVMSRDVDDLRAMSYRRFAAMTAAYLPSQGAMQAAHVSQLADRVNRLAASLRQCGHRRLPRGKARARLKKALLAVERRACALRQRL